MPAPTKNRRYVGFSTVVGDGSPTQQLFDAELVAQDLRNVLNTHKGEVLTDPSFGCIAWDMLFEPATEENFNLIKQDVMNIFNFEPRVKVQSISVTGSTDPQNPGFTMQAQLLYVGQNISGTFVTNFFQNLAKSDIGV